MKTIREGHIHCDICGPPPKYHVFLTHPKQICIFYFYFFQIKIKNENNAYFVEIPTKIVKYSSDAPPPKKKRRKKKKKHPKKFSYTQKKKKFIGY